MILKQWRRRRRNVRMGKMWNKTYQRPVFSFHESTCKVCGMRTMVPFLGREEDQKSWPFENLCPKCSKTWMWE
jgi:hypothetical protein